MISTTLSSLADLPTSNGGVIGWAIGGFIIAAVLVTAIIIICVVVLCCKKGKLYHQGSTCMHVAAMYLKTKSTCSDVMFLYNLNSGDMATMTTESISEYVQLNLDLGRL